MGRIGDIFREQRLSKGLTLDQVSDETNISTRYLQGIENDNFQNFPGEVYIQGFIRNYAEFLGLDPERMISRYRAQEEAAPGTSDLLQSSPSAAAQPAVQPQQASPQTPVQPQQASPPSREASTSTLFPEVMQEPAADEKAGEPRSSGASTAGKPKPRVRKAKAVPPSENPPAAQIQPEPVQSLPSATSPNPLPIPPAEPIPAKPAAEPVRPAPQRRFPLFILSALALAAILAVVFVSVRSSKPQQAPNPSRTPTEYRAEGLPFEQRIYPGDRIYLPLDNDFISVMLDSVADKAAFTTPYGSFQTGLNEETVINPSTDRERLVLTVKDFAPKAPQHGVLVRCEAREALTAPPSDTGITIGPAGSASGSVALSKPSDTPVVVFKSPSGPHQFFVNVSFVSPVMFRYEADRREWVEKYYRKGESITINVSSSVTFWTSNAQSVRINVYQSAGKSVEFSMGGAGEISVKRLSWSASQGGWALVATTLE